jgi:hypothetical protein
MAHEDQALLGDRRQEIVLIVSPLDTSHRLSRRHVSQNNLSNDVLFEHSIIYAAIEAIIVLTAIHPVCS